jgi:hypothetical protein
MPSRSLASRFTLIPEPVGAVVIDSPSPPEVVLENLRERGREWRESAMPESVKKAKVVGLKLEITGAEFEMRWLARSNPLYNPLCYGIVQPYGQGSRIRAGFRVDQKAFWMLMLPFASIALSFFIHAEFWYGVLAGLFVIYTAFLLLTRRTPEPMRSALIEVIERVARQRPNKTRHTVPPLL